MQVDESDKAAISDLLLFKKDIESGVLQRGFKDAGARKITATFEWLDK